MDLLILLIWGLGLLLSLVGGLWLVILAFRQSLLWGLAVFFIPFASLFFIVKYWTEARTPFFVSLVSVVLILVGASFGALTASPFGAAVPSGSGMADTETTGFEASPDPFGGGDPLGSGEPARVEDPSPEAPGAATGAGTVAGETGGGDAETDVESLLAEIDERGTGATGAAADTADTAATGGAADPATAAGRPAPEPTSTATPGTRRDGGSRVARSPSSVSRSGELPRRNDRRVPPDQLSRHVGTRLEVHMIDGDRLKGVLEGVEEDQIRLQVTLGGGSMTLRLPFARIEEILRPR